MSTAGTASPPSSSHTITPSSPDSPLSGTAAPDMSSTSTVTAPEGAGSTTAVDSGSSVPSGLAQRRGGSGASAVQAPVGEALVGASSVSNEGAVAAGRAADRVKHHVRLAPVNTSAAAIKPGEGRPRSSSLVQVTKVEETTEQLLDQSAGFNANADWVNYKGAWVIHVVLILLAKILLDVIPGMHQDMSWTLVNVGYMGISYIMFHYVTGTPFDSNSGAYDDLTLWEQIDDGAQYTPAKKWLTSVPIGLFLISTHYTRYNPWLFSLNFFVTLFVLFPKLPILHRLRFKIMPRSPYPSLPPTPTHSRPSTPAFARR
ncbi:ORMDL-domain-containing protein [Tilletiaria anomala UBC 951]|uniref:ORMDL-domain-containing protein n=1 Tax=Tilletiaria anomala (strain ATCC 24038 / CBS 436.72 / UBC 951) TaxID=1037660 RepID=A0A066VT49_TILAU|nr:ORMDL-domain-containing protein [Tilletiaria anomala UBC 951]KDN44872.1 ORMDL-domain-containing protein [Tilletiaria anomala UBC 951]